MEAVYKPYIIYLTSRQEQELWQYFRQSCWQIGVFKCVHQDLQFLVDLMVHDEELALDTCKKQVKGKRQARKRQYGNGATTLDGKKFCRRNENQLSDTTEHMDLKAIEDDKKNLEYNQSILEQNNISKTLITIEQSSSEKDGKDEDLPIRNVLEINSVETFNEENIQDKQRGTNLQDHSVEGNMNGKVDAGKEQSGDSDIIDTIIENTKRRLRSANRKTQNKNRYKLKQLADMAERWTNFSCKICGKVAASEQHLKRHIIRLHSEEALKKKEKEKKRKQQQEVNACRICRKQFADKYALNTHHLNMHSDKKAAYQCDLCGAVLKHMGNLVQHKKSLHSGTRQHKCDICGSKFKLPQHLKTHMRRHDPDFVETCTICGKTLRKGHLSTHMKRHTSERKFNCDKCGKKFYEKQDLEIHVILHSGEKPNKCPYCPYACAFKGNLTKHINIRHQNETSIIDLKRANSKNTINMSSKEEQSESNLAKLNSKPHSNIQTSTIKKSSSFVQYVNKRRVESDQNCSENELNIESMNSNNSAIYFGDDLRRNSTSNIVTLLEGDTDSEQFTPDTRLQNVI